MTDRTNLVIVKQLSRNLRSHIFHTNRNTTTGRGTEAYGVQFSPVAAAARSSLPMR